MVKVDGREDGGHRVLVGRLKGVGERRQRGGGGVA